MPLTMPVSTAHSTCGYRCAASPNGQCSETSVSDVAARLGVRGEPVRGERVGDRRDRGLHRAVAFGRLHARRDRAAVLVADLFGERAAPRRPGAARARGRAGCASRSSRRGGNARWVSSRGGAVALRRPARRLVPRELDVEVAAGRELLEVVAGDVGVEREALGDLGRLRAVGAARGRTGRCRGGSGRRRRW